jgi:hypothetical protein
MTPQDKAMELMLRYYELIPMNTISFAKQCALIAVDEIVNQFQSMSDTKSVLFINDEITYVIHHLVYWQEVKQEIEKL